MPRALGQRANATAVIITHVTGILTTITMNTQATTNIRMFNCVVEVILVIGNNKNVPDESTRAHQKAIQLEPNKIGVLDGIKNLNPYPNTILKELMTQIGAEN